MRVGQGEFVEVVDVRDAEVERGQEDCLRGGGDAGEEVEGDDEGAEDQLFGDGAGDVVPVADPAGERFEDELAALEVVEVVLDDDFLEERARVEEEG